MGWDNVTNKEVVVQLEGLLLVELLGKGRLDAVLPFLGREKDVTTGF